MKSMIYNALSLVALATLACGCAPQKQDQPVTSPAPTRVTLTSQRAQKFDEVTAGSIVTQSLHERLELDDEIALEASGVVAQGPSARWGVVFDSFTLLATLDPEVVSEKGEIVSDEDSDDLGYEGLSFDTRAGRYYALVEAKERSGKGKDPRPQIHVYDASWELIEEQKVDFDLDSLNKGMEGVAHLYLEDELYLLMLCESNECKEKGGDRGEGRIHVFSLDGDKWEHVDRIKLPESLDFKDYSGLDLREGGQIAVSSQEDSAVWLGQLSVEIDEDGAPDWRIAKGDVGRIIELPRDEDGDEIFCNIEGVSFADERTLVLVSDRRKPQQPKRCAGHDQSVHVLELP